MEDKIKKMFEENCIVEKEGKKYLNEFGTIVICLMTINIANYLLKELGLIKEKGVK